MNYVGKDEGMMHLFAAVVEQAASDLQYLKDKGVVTADMQVNTERLNDIRGKDGEAWGSFVYDRLSHKSRQLTQYANEVIEWWRDGWVEEFVDITELNVSTSALKRGLGIKGGSNDSNAA